MWVSKPAVRRTQKALDNMYRKYKSALLLGALSLSLGACNKYLDQDPDARIKIDSEAKVYQLLDGAYPTVLPVLISELSSDNIQHNGFHTSLTIAR